MTEYEGKVALVTGAARGIGRAVAVKLAQDGADVALLDVADQIPGYPQPLGTRADLEETAELVRKTGRRALELVADVRDSDAVSAAVTRTIDELGGLHVVVANAGLAVHAPFVSQTDESWRLVLDTNLLGAAWVIRAALPHLVGQHYGRIVTVSSVGGRMGVPGVASYAASKWALIGMTKTVALEHAADGITANVVAPTTVTRRCTATITSTGTCGRTCTSRTCRSRNANDGSARWSPAASTRFRCRGSTPPTSRRRWRTWPATGPGT